MTAYIAHNMNDYSILHDILHGITCHSMEFVLVPTGWTRLRRQDLRLPPRRRVHVGAARCCRGVGLGVHSGAGSFSIAVTCCTLQRDPTAARG